ncbi:MAG: geranylgeranyl reductase family protein [Candidatus Thorarchaeota archaeon]
MPYDVCVVGAGPAGSTCAKYLVERGLRVIVVDRQEFPRDKPCGGAFSPDLIDDFPYLRGRSSEFVESVSTSGVLWPSNRGAGLRGGGPLMMVLRRKFDQVLLEEAQDAGAETLMGSHVRTARIGREYCMMDVSPGHEIRARVVVGADGASSTVARAVHIRNRWPAGTVTACRVAEIPAGESWIESAFGRERTYSFYANLGGQPGYGWVFPKMRTINVGLGVVSTHARSLSVRFKQFVRLLERKGHLPREPDLTSERGAIVPTGGVVGKTYADRCLLVGDSAGMVNPLTGGGIAYAMRAARAAASVLGHCLTSDRLDRDSLSRYETVWRSDFGREMRGLLVAQRLFTGPMANVLFEIGSRDKLLQKLVSDALVSKGGDERNEILRRVVARLLRVCLVEGLHLRSFSGSARSAGRDISSATN